MSSCRCLKVKTEVFDLVVGVERKELEREAATKKWQIWVFLTLSEDDLVLLLPVIFVQSRHYSLYSQCQRGCADFMARLESQCKHQGGIFEKDPDFRFWEIKLHILLLTCVFCMAVGITSLICKIGVILCTSLVY